ncbi:MAG: AmmeMemoRadiSam system protein A [Sulfuricaulis sp.]
MALTSSNNPVSELAPPNRQTLLQIARESIRKGLCGETHVVRVDDYPEPLRAKRATFITLQLNDTLRGCMGTLIAHQSLVEDVVNNAWNAAFRDTRFAALTWPEFERLEIHISILSQPEQITFSSEEDLLSKLNPYVDGLILQEGLNRGTFLPSVWESLPTPREFLRHLKLKAGLNADYWSSQIRVQRYTTESIS